LIVFLILIFSLIINQVFSFIEFNFISIVYLETNKSDEHLLFYLLEEAMVLE